MHAIIVPLQDRVGPVDFRTKAPGEHDQNVRDSASLKREKELEDISAKVSGTAVVRTLAGCPFLVRVSRLLLMLCFY